jgi:hypothetical protein
VARRRGGRPAAFFSFFARIFSARTSISVQSTASVRTTIGWSSGSEIVDCFERGIRSGWRLPPFRR